MKCPRCEIEAQEGRCPQCGQALSEAEKEPTPGPVSQAPLQFSVSSKSAPTAATVDWRAELQRKMRKYARKKGEPLPGRSTASPAERRRKRSSSAGEADSGEKSADRTEAAGPGKSEQQDPLKREIGLERPLFKYRLEDMEKEPRRKIVTFEQTRPPRSPLEKPLIRKPVRSSDPARTGPEQKSLTLEVVASSTAAPPPTALPESARASSESEPSVSGEILFSRVLGAIIDLLIAGAAGFLFTYIASRLLGSAFPSGQSLIVAGASGLLFLFFNSVFFLYTLGATPGMSGTDLKVVVEDGGAVSLRTAMVRTVLSFVVTATLVGLVWSLFDPRRRCWHDRLSGTVVVPGGFEMPRSGDGRSD